jgi:hypothetical protein
MSRAAEPRAGDGIQRLLAAESAAAQRVAEARKVRGWRPGWGVPGGQGPAEEPRAAGGAPLFLLRPALPPTAAPPRLPPCPRAARRPRASG